MKVKVPLYIKYKYDFIYNMFHKECNPKDKIDFNSMSILQGLFYA